MLRRVPAILILGLFAFPAPARADWLISPWVGVKFAASLEPQVLDVERSTSERAMTWGVSVALLGNEVVGIEADFGWVNGFFEGVEPVGNLVTSSRAITLMGNVVVTVPTAVSQYGLRPYVSGGVGLIHARSTAAGDVVSTSSNMFGLNVGGGAIGPLTERTSLRFDIRKFRSSSGSDAPPDSASWSRIGFWRATAGLTFRFPI